MNGQAWLTAGVGALGIVSTFSAGLLGKRSERRTGLESWLRDHRLRAFADLSGLTHGFTRAVMKMIVEAEDVSSLTPNFEALKDLRREFGRVVDLIELLGPANVLEQALALFDAVKAMMDEINSDRKLRAFVPYRGEHLELTWAAARELKKAADEFTAAAGRALTT